MVDVNTMMANPLTDVMRLQNANFVGSLRRAMLDVVLLGEQQLKSAKKSSERSRAKAEAKSKSASKAKAKAKAAAKAQAKAKAKAKAKSAPKAKAEPTRKAMAK